MFKKLNPVVTATIMVVTLALGLGLLSMLQGCHLNEQPGMGKKIGQIVKVAKVGVLWKTYEVELVRGGLTNGSGVSGGQAFEATVRDGALARLLAQAMDAQEEIVVTYEVDFICSVASSETPCVFITGIESAH